MCIRDRPGTNQPSAVFPSPTGATAGVGFLGKNESNGASGARQKAARLFRTDRTTEMGVFQLAESNQPPAVFLDDSAWKELTAHEEKRIKPQCRERTRDMDSPNEEAKRTSPAKDEPPAGGRDATNKRGQDQGTTEIECYTAESTVCAIAEQRARQQWRPV